jgi:hypothetical protein
MEKLVEVELKNGKMIRILPREIAGLEDQILKEHKTEELEITKDASGDIKSQETKAKKAPVNISQNSFKGGSKKK